VISKYRERNREKKERGRECERGEREKERNKEREGMGERFCQNLVVPCNARYLSTSTDV
jgi:hypothetical protein